MNAAVFGKLTFWGGSYSGFWYSCSLKIFVFKVQKKLMLTNKNTFYKFYRIVKKYLVLLSKWEKNQFNLEFLIFFRYCTKRLEPNRRLCLSRTGADPQHCRKNEYRYRTSEAKLSNTSTYSLASLPTWYKQLLYVVSSTITKHPTNDNNTY